MDSEGATCWLLVLSRAESGGVLIHECRRRCKRVWAPYAAWPLALMRSGGMRRPERDRTSIRSAPHTSGRARRVAATSRRTRTMVSRGESAQGAATSARGTPLDEAQCCQEGIGGDAGP